ncbi:MAG: LCP family protein [Candidatus Doudnabacteria bacterium]
MNINKYEDEGENPGIKKHSRTFPKFFWTILILLMIVLGVLFAKAYNLGNKVFISNTSFFQKFQSLFFRGSGTSLIGEDKDRINVLLLGYGGEGHDGTYLTDTMILASIKPSTKEVLITTIPRDLYWEDGQQKINAAYAFTREKTHDPTQAGLRTSRVVENLSGLTVPYFATMDFRAFEKAVDRVGGLDVTVEKTFTDAQFPDENFGYLAPVTFTQGSSHMNGVRALEFARSRHGNNDENSDFARSKRQSLIIAAFKEKMTTLNLFSNTGTINDLTNILADHANTNLDPSELLRLAQIMRDKDVKIISQSLDTDSGLLCPDLTGPLGYLLIKCPGISDDDIRNVFLNGFDGAEIRKEKSTIILENAGTDSVLYSSIKKSLASIGVTVYEVPYRGLPLLNSALYQINSKPATIKYLEDKLNIKAQEKPAQMTANSDLVLIIGGSNN